jgi:hypothetical protein
MCVVLPPWSSDEGVHAEITQGRIWWPTNEPKNDAAILSEWLKVSVGQ